MRLKQLLRFVDGLKKNSFSDEVKTAWVNEVEGMVQTDVLRLSLEDVVQYGGADDQDPELIVQPPHDRLYRYYLEAMICYEQEEYDRYENCMQMFNRNLNDYVRWVAETLRPQDTLACFKGYYLSAYAIAVKLGFAGTEAEWVASLKGDKGDPFLYEDFTPEQLEALTEGIQDYAVQAAQSAVEQTAQAAAELVQQAVAADAQAARQGQLLPPRQPRAPQRPGRRQRPAKMRRRPRQIRPSRPRRRRRPQHRFPGPRQRARLRARRRRTARPSRPRLRRSMQRRRSTQ